MMRGRAEVARQAHNLKVVSSNLTRATNSKLCAPPTVCTKQHLTTTIQWVYSRSQESKMVVYMDRNWLRKIGYDEEEITLLVEALSVPFDPEQKREDTESALACATLDSAAAA